MNGEILSAGEMHERERRFELVISNLLRIGVGFSSAIIVLGMILVFVHYPNYRDSRAD